MASASDDFTRAAAEDPAAAPWLSVNAVGDIAGGARIDATLDYLWSGGAVTRISLYDGGITWANDQTSEGPIAALGVGAHYAIFVARFTQTGNGYAVDTDGTTTTIYRVTAGVFTSIKASTIDFANGDSMGIRVAGNTIFLRKGGADVDSVTDTTYPTGGRPGLGGYGNANITSWAGVDVPAAGSELSGDAVMPGPTAAGGLAGPASQLSGDAVMPGPSAAGGLAGPGSQLSGDAVMPGPSAAGGLSGGTSSALSGGATLPGPSAGGGLASGAGTFTSEDLRRNNDALAGSVSLDYVAFHNPATGALVVIKTGVSTNASGIFTTSDPLLVPGTSYLAVWRESTGERGWGVATAA